MAILSTPRFAAFGADRLNVFVAYPPFVWLPAVLVLAALAGHLLVFRALAVPGGLNDRATYRLRVTCRTLSIRLLRVSRVASEVS